MADLTREEILAKVNAGESLKGAKLQQADLSGAHLYGADLRGADLRGADLYRANLFRADLGKAVYDAETKWPEVLQYQAAGAELRED
mgnify:CR=1 FL=1